MELLVNFSQFWQENPLVCATFQLASAFNGTVCMIQAFRDVRAESMEVPDYLGFLKATDR